MLHNVVESILRAASNFQHISILQGTKVYGVHLHPILFRRERDARKTIITSSSITKIMCVRWRRHGFKYTALRPQLVTGPTPGALNVLPAIGVTRQFATKRVNRSASLAVHRSSGKRRMQTLLPT